MFLNIYTVYIYIYKVAQYNSWTYPISRIPDICLPRVSSNNAASANYFKHHI